MALGYVIGNFVPQQNHQKGDAQKNVRSNSNATELANGCHRVGEWFSVHFVLTKNIHLQTIYKQQQQQQKQQKIMSKLIVVTRRRTFSRKSTKDETKQTNNKVSINDLTAQQKKVVYLLTTLEGTFEDKQD